MILLWKLGRRLREETGFGLIELLIAMLMLNIGILAVAAAFTSGQVSLRRAGAIATASTLADSQMELYRAVKYDLIKLHQASVSAADSTYKCDAAYGASGCDPFSDTDSTKNVIFTTCTTPVPDYCNPSRTATGADGKSYRIDTFITEDTVSSGRPVRRVMVVVRNPTTLATLARQSSNFDASTGS